MFGTEVSEEEEAAGRRRRRSGERDVGSACTVGWREEKRKTNDQEKRDHNGAHRNLSLRPQNTERSFCMSYKRI